MYRLLYILLFYFGVVPRGDLYSSLQTKSVVGYSKNCGIMCILCTLDQEIGRHIDRHLTDVSVDISAE